MQTIANLKRGTFPIVVAFSGGKDSIAMVLYLLEQGIDPQRIHLHHHNVDGRGRRLFDWQCTESYCQAFAQAFNLKLFISYREGGIFREILRKNEPLQDICYQLEPSGPFLRIKSKKNALNTRMKFPAVSSNLLIRWCSSVVKIEVLISVVRRHPAYSNELFVLTGERRLESRARSKYKEFDLYPAATKSRKATLCRPILAWSEPHVWEIISRWKVQPHPAYMIGWGRCSCQLCIFSSPDLWATTNIISPEKVNAIALIEKQINFTLYNNQNIKSMVATGKPLSNLSPYWVAQATREFTAPIICAHWELPIGAYKTQSAGAN